MKRRDVIVLSLAGLLILSMAFLGIMTGQAVKEGSDSDVLNYIVRGSKEEPKIQCELEPLKNRNVKIPDVDGSLVIECNNVVGLCSDSATASKYAEIIIGQGGGRCIYFTGKFEDYAAGTRISYNGIERKIRIVADTADKVVKPSKIANFIPLPVRARCDEEIDLKVNPIKTKIHGSIIRIEATFKCKTDKVPPNAIIKYGGKIIKKLSLIPQGSRVGVYSNVYLTENSGKHEIIIQYGNLRERIKLKI